MKNFIRGMGVGILITTIVFAIAYMLVGNEISDEEIKSRATSLGMVEKDQTVVLPKEGTDNNEEENVGTESETEQITQVTPDALSEVTQPAAEEAQQEPPVAEQSQQNETSGEGGNDEVQQIQIQSGMDGVTVSYMLEEKGIVDSAEGFNDYLSAHRLQLNIRQGSYELKKGMSYEEVADKIVY